LVAGRNRSAEFLRQRQNRPALRRRSDFAVFVQLSLVAFGIAVGGFLAWLGNEYVQHNQTFRLRDLRLDGVPADLRPAVETMLAPALEANLLTMDLGWVHRQVGRIPEVRQVRVRRVLPDRVHVGVDVRRPFAFLRTPTWTRPVSRDGFVLGHKAGFTGPEIFSGERVTVTPERRLDDGVAADYESAAAVLDWLPGADRALFERLVRIRLDPRGVMLVLRAPGWELLLGDATRLDAKLSGFQRIAIVDPPPEGSLIDLRYDNMVVIAADEDDVEG
jgi:hypothetical protein